MLQMQAHNENDVIELCHTSCVCPRPSVSSIYLTNPCPSYSSTAAVCKTT